MTLKFRVSGHLEIKAMHAYFGTFLFLFDTGHEVPNMDITPKIE